MNGFPIERVIAPGIVATAALFVFIIWKAKRNSRIDAMNEENPRRMWYKLGCTGCGKPTPHAQVTDGLCPECYAPSEAAAEVQIEITMPMLNAGIDAMRDNPQLDARGAAAVFRAMLKAMPLEQKRVLLNNPIFAAPPE